LDNYLINKRCFNKNKTGKRREKK
jgi:hypothetical protein